MKLVKYMWIILALGLIGSVVDAGDGNSRRLFYKKLKAQTRDITPAKPGQNAVSDKSVITASDAWDSTRFNPNRMIELSHQFGVNLNGIANPDAVKAILGDRLDPAVVEIAPGVSGTPVSLIVTESAGWKGCTCPPYFNEIMVTALVQDPGLENGVTLSTLHLAQLHMETDHLKRQHTLITKFDTDIQFAGFPKRDNVEKHIGWFEQEDSKKITGIYVKDQRGRRVFSAKRNQGSIPRPHFKLRNPETGELALMDYVFYTTGQGRFNFDGNKRFDLMNVDGFRFSQSHFRIQDKNHTFSHSPVGEIPAELFFNSNDQMIFHQPDKGVAKVLRSINFQPLYWSSELIQGAMAWSPNP